MTFFDILSNLLFKRSISNNEDDIQGFAPYMVSRWLSFYGKSQCVFVNETLNRFSTIEENKSDVYKLYYELIPRLQYKKINYIKKSKPDEQEGNEQDIINLSKNHYISTREIKMYMDLPIL